MKKKVLIIELLMSLILIIIALLYDKQIIVYIASLRNYFLDYIFLSVAFASNAIIIFFFLTTLFLWKEHKRRWILPLWMASFFSVAISFIIKISVKRPRPFQDGTISALKILFNFMKDNFNTWNFSFPSFQAMLAFSALPLLNKEFRNFKYIWLIFAILVAFSRVYFGVHYLSDVLAGALIGYLIGYSLVIIEEKYKPGLKLIKKIKIS